MCGMIFFFAKFVEQLREKSCSNLMGRLSLENTGRGCPMPGQKCTSFMVPFTLPPSPHLLLAETREKQKKNGFPQTSEAFRKDGSHWIPQPPGPHQPFTGSL